MSDDKDKSDLVDGMWVKVPNVFESHEFDFMSEEVSSTGVDGSN